MKPLSLFAVLGAFALAACEPLPPTHPRAGPGPGWDYRLPPPGPVEIARAERACVAQAQRQGLRVRGVVSTDPVVAGRGRIIGMHSVLRVSDRGRRGRGYEVRCHYTFDTRIARITLRRG